MSGDRQHLGVHLEAAELGAARRVGTLSHERAGARSVISFAYEPDWLTAATGFPLDPALPLFEGDQFPSALPGIFADAAPDRWGRTLLERREAMTARSQRRRPGRLDDWDFLVGVSDPVRMGALRLSSGSEFIDAEALAVPPLTRLRELEQLALEVEEGNPSANDGDEERRWIAMLLAPGSSLGGARPKANFRAEDGTLWIAKFPSREDRHDVGAWEYVSWRLARRAGIEVPQARLLTLGSGYRTFCTRRFDREGEGRRLYASAMTLTGARDHERASYLDIARAIVEQVAPEAIDADLRQLFRRLVFNVLSGNRDDHLRNHGFLRTTAGWRLSPAFDVNPSPRASEHSLAIDDLIRQPDLDLVRESAPLYRLSAPAVAEIVAEVATATARWRHEAATVGCGSEEIERLSLAFEVSDQTPPEAEGAPLG